MPVDTSSVYSQGINDKQVTMWQESLGFENEHKEEFIQIHKRLGIDVMYCPVMCE